MNPDDPYAATRCRICLMAEHMCKLLKMQRESCCGDCDHRPRTDEK